jgi:hypothetical protein
VNGYIRIYIESYNDRGEEVANRLLREAMNELIAVCGEDVKPIADALIEGLQRNMECWF